MILRPIFRQYIDSHKLDDWHWELLSSNINAISLLKQNPDKIVWKPLSLNENAAELFELYPDNVDPVGVSLNPNAIRFLERHPDKIVWWALSENPNALCILEKNMDKINWTQLSTNINALYLLKNHQDKIAWSNLSANSQGCSILELKENYEKINWNCLSGNPNAISLLTQNPTKIVWKYLSANPHPDAIELLRKRLQCERYRKYVDVSYLCQNANPQALELLKEYVDISQWDWYHLSANPNAIELLKQYPNKILWSKLATNPNKAAIEMIEENYERMNVNLEYSYIWANPNIFMSDMLDIIANPLAVGDTSLGTALPITPQPPITPPTLGSFTASRFMSPSANIDENERYNAECEYLNQIEEQCEIAQQEEMLQYIRPIQDRMELVNNIDADVDDAEYELLDYDMCVKIGGLMMESLTV